MSTPCSRCGHLNHEGMSFCVKCAASLTQQCASCGGANPADAVFCGKCAARLDRPADTGQPAPVRADVAHPGAAAATASASAAERRQLTVMFCDLVGSTELSQRVDAEEYGEIVAAYQATCSAVVKRFDGHVARYLGDGLLVYFGYPRAREDAAVRAVRAALGILDAVPSLSAGLAADIPVLAARPLEVRIGIHTGAVVVGAVGGDPGRDDVALGDAVNIAARLQGVAESGTIVISAATRRLVGDVFVVENAGAPQLKGIAEPMPVFRVLHAASERARPARTVLGLAGLVGREQEIALMLDRWEQAVEGHGQVVMMSGDAGIGKSRLVQALRERLAGTSHTWIDGACSPYHENSALYPVNEAVAQIVGIEREDSPDAKVAKLEAVLGSCGIALDDAVPLLATLLSIDVPDRYPALHHLSGDAQRQKTLELLAALLFAMSEQRPVVLAIEDVHWIDPSSLELLQLVVAEAPTARLLIVVTFRPGVDVSWATRSHVVHLTLHPLTRVQVAAIVDRLTGGKALPTAVMNQVVAKTDGVPLFVEELTKAILESDLLIEGERQFERNDPLPGFAIPATLQDSLMARLDRLGAAKEVAQLAAVLGREFRHELLEAVWPADVAALTDALDELAAAELLYRRGMPPRAVYTFKHALIQETAYESLLKKRRHEYHARIALALEQRFPDRAVLEPEVVARHFEEAGLIARAIPYYERAGERASQRSAHQEAISHFRKGIDLLAALPPSRERDQQEVRLQVKLGTSLLESRGYGDGDVRRAYERARQLSQDIGDDTPEMFRAVWGLAVFYHARSELDTTLEMGATLLGVAERSGDASLLVSANLSAGCPLLWQGKFPECLTRMERVIALYDRDAHRSLAYVYGENPGVSSRAYASMALSYLGFPDRALRMIEEAVAVAEEGAHPFSLGYAVCFLAGTYLLRGDRDAGRVAAERAIAIAEKQHLGLWLRIGRFYRACALVEPHTGRTALAPLEEAVARLAETGTEVGASFFLARFAEAYGVCGCFDDGLRIADNALALAELRQAPFWNAEVHRVKAELLLQRDGSAAADEAERLFRRGLEIARAQQARLFELRIAMPLARLLRRRGEPREARALLAPIYAWFTEGADTPDLRDARALLDELT
jgi:class 3 adenylate cyclase/tetratricopeptide (TPR) repeat protein